jgi:hypothetical protein
VIASGWVRALVVSGSLLCPVAVSSDARADSASVPLGLQVELFAKVASYDKTLPGRAEGVVRVLVVTRKGLAESASAAAHVLNALSNTPRIAGFPHEDSTVEFTDAAELAALCRTRSMSILYMTPGLADVDEAVAKALVGVPVLSVSASAEGVPKGMVLGFDLVGGKSKLLVNLSSCRNQGVGLSADVLKIATVVQ